MSEESKRRYRGGGGGFAYFLGIIGSSVFYFRAASDFWSYAFALPKAFVWPAFLVYDLLAYVHG